MGPFELLDVVGLDVSLAIQRDALPGVPRARLRAGAAARAPGDRGLPGPQDRPRLPRLHALSRDGGRRTRRPDSGIGRRAVDPLGSAATHDVEEHPDGDWVVRPRHGIAASTTAYRCPGCDQEIRPGDAARRRLAGRRRRPGATGGTGTPPAGRPATGAAARRSASANAPPLDRLTRARRSTRRREIRASTVLPARRDGRSSCTPPTGCAWSASWRCRSTGRRSRPWSACTRCPPTAASWTATSAARRPGGCRRSPGWRCCASTPAARPAPRGTSEGAFDEGDAERSTSRRPSSTPSSTSLPRPWLVGWSFGTELALRYGLRPGDRRGDPALAAAALRHRRRPRRAGRRPASRWSRWCPSSTTTCSRAEARERFARVPQAEVVGVDGGQAPVGGGAVGPARARRDRAPRGAGGVPAADDGAASGVAVASRVRSAIAVYVRAFVRLCCVY